MTELRIERFLPAGPERVWRALTDPAALAAWFWPKRLGTRASADPRPGGEFRIAATTSALAVSGVYTVVEPPHRLEFTWRWDGHEAETVVSIELTANGAGTTLVLTHARFADETDWDNHAIGWSECLGRLPGFLDDGDDPDHPADDASAAPPARRRRSPPQPPQPNRPRLLGGPEDIGEAMRPRADRLGPANQSDRAGGGQAGRTGRSGQAGR